MTAQFYILTILCLFLDTGLLCFNTQRLYLFYSFYPKIKHFALKSLNFQTLELLNYTTQPSIFFKPLNACAEVINEILAHIGAAMKSLHIPLLSKLMYKQFY